MTRGSFMSVGSSFAGTLASQLCSDHPRGEEYSLRLMIVR